MQSQNRWNENIKKYFQRFAPHKVGPIQTQEQFWQSSNAILK